MSTTPFKISRGGPILPSQLAAFAESDDDENAMQDLACARSKAEELKVTRDNLQIFLHKIIQESPVW